MRGLVTEILFQLRYNFFIQTIKFLEIKAKDNFEFGYKLGRKLVVLIKKRVDWYVQSIPHYKVEDVKDDLEKFIPPIMKYYPHIMEEILGMAEGAKVNLINLLLAMFDEETIFLSSRPRVPRCTTVGVHLDNDDIVIGHNEDWVKEVRHDGMAIVKAEIGTSKFISLFYIGSLPGTSCGLNSHGIGFSGNSIDGKKFRFGIPKNVHMRALLDAKNLQEAKYIDLFKSSINGNVMLASKEEGLLDSEDLLRIHRLFKSRKFLVHTNHPIEAKYQNKNNTGEESIDSYDYLMDRLTTSNILNEDLVKSCLKVHSPVDICGHSSRKCGYAEGVTVASAYINATQGFIDIAHATPCNHPYKRFYL